jgi:hypothetical protein
MNGLSLLLSKSHHLTLSNYITKSNSAWSNFVRTVAVGKSTHESKSDSTEFSAEVKQSADLSDSISRVSHSIALSRPLRDSMDFWFDNSESLSVSLDPAMSHIFSSGQFPAAAPFTGAAAQGSGGIWAVLGSLLLLVLLLCCLVLFMLWRRKKRSPEDCYGAELSDEAGLEFDSAMGDGTDYDHEYWNPLESDGSMTDGPDEEGGSGQEGSWADDTYEYVDPDQNAPELELEAPPGFDHEYMNPLLSDSSHEYDSEIGGGWEEEYDNASDDVPMELSDWLPSEGNLLASREQEADEAEYSLGALMTRSTIGRMICHWASKAPSLTNEGVKATH